MTNTTDHVKVAVADLTALGVTKVSQLVLFSRICYIALSKLPMLTNTPDFFFKSWNWDWFQKVLSTRSPWWKKSLLYFIHVSYSQNKCGLKKSKCMYFPDVWSDSTILLYMVHYASEVKQFANVSINWKTIYNLCIYRVEFVYFLIFFASCSFGMKS